MSNIYAGWEVIAMSPTSITVRIGDEPGTRVVVVFSNANSFTMREDQYTEYIHTPMEERHEKLIELAIKYADKYEEDHK